MREKNLERFIKAQESEFKTALAEIKFLEKRVARLQEKVEYQHEFCRPIWA